MVGPEDSHNGDGRSRAEFTLIRNGLTRPLPICSRTATKVNLTERPMCGTRSQGLRSSRQFAAVAFLWSNPPQVSSRFAPADYQGAATDLCWLDKVSV